MALGIGALIGAAAAGETAKGAIGLGQQAWSQSFQRKEAEKNRDFARGENALNRDFNAQQAQLARDFSERMSSTAYQRSMNDMRAAGVNPALMINGAAASTPQAASAGSGASGAPGAGSAGVPNLGSLGSIFSSALMATIKGNSKDFANNIIKSMDFVDNDEISPELEAELNSASWRK